MTQITETELTARIQSEKQRLARELDAASAAILNFLSLRRWFAEYPVEAAFLLITGAAILTEAADKRRLQRRRPMQAPRPPVDLQAPLPENVVPVRKAA